MDEIWTTLGLAVVLFASTNVDDVFVLLALFADPRVHPAAVVAGQVIGMLALVLATLAVSALALVLARSYVGLLGLFPLGIGLWQLARRARSDGDDEAPAVTRRNLAAQTVAVTLITIANGGDNLAVYVPVFATRDPFEILLLGGSFLVLTGVWCWLGYLLVSHPRLGAPIRRFAARATPWVLIALGLFILIESEAHRAFS
jgi:cadmium resistance protein CadD (predicted permease)